jgi:hypothetical protein
MLFYKHEQQPQPLPYEVSYMKDFSYETIFTSLKNKLVIFLKENNYKFEVSGCEGDYYFSIGTDDEGARKINDFLDSESILINGGEENE